MSKLLLVLIVINLAINIISINCINETEKDLIAKINLKTKTFNWCKIFKIDYPEKRHAIKIESVLKPFTQKASKFAQHLVLWLCKHPDPSALDKYTSGPGLDCTNSNDLPTDYRRCFNIFFNLDNPDVVFETGDNNAIAIGDQYSKYLMLNVHINVAEHEFLNRDVEIGVRLSLADKHRKNELQQMITGAHLSIYGVLVPPNRQNFINVGHCAAQCFKNSMPSEGITITHIYPHFHHFGRKFRTRHFRNNEELSKIISIETNGSMEGLAYRKLSPEVRLTSNDIITTECTYDSTSTSRTLMTDATDVADEEMCLSFFMVYPRLYYGKPLPQTCFSGFNESTLAKASGVEDELTGYWHTSQPKIKQSNRRLSRVLQEKTDWAEDIQELIHYSKKRIRCNMFESNKDESNNIQFINYPDKYIPEPLLPKYGSAKADNSKNKPISSPSSSSGSDNTESSYSKNDWRAKWMYWRPNSRSSSGSAK